MTFRPGMRPRAARDRKAEQHGKSRRRRRSRPVRGAVPPASCSRNTDVTPGARQSSAGGTEEEASPTGRRRRRGAADCPRRAAPRTSQGRNPCCSRAPTGGRRRSRPKPWPALVLGSLKATIGSVRMFTSSRIFTPSTLPKRTSLMYTIARRLRRARPSTTSPWRWARGHRCETDVRVSKTWAANFPHGAEGSQSTTFTRLRQVAQGGDQGVALLHGDLEPVLGEVRGANSCGRPPGWSCSSVRRCGHPRAPFRRLLEIRRARS